MLQLLQKTIPRTKYVCEVRNAEMNFQMDTKLVCPSDNNQLHFTEHSSLAFVLSRIICFVISFP